MTKPIKVLLVEDEITLAMIIKDALTDSGYHITMAKDGAEGMKLFFETKPDILIADVMMPKLDGFEMVEKIRQRDNTTPILFLTARSAIKDVVEGFELGGNDYLKKPFNMQELVVRINALVGSSKNNSEQESRTEFEIGNYIFNSSTQQLHHYGDEEGLSNRESELLRLFCLHKNSIVETRTILLELWGDDSFFNTKSLHVFITKLRRKLERDSNVRIINIRGVGYKLISQPYGLKIL